MAMSIHLREDDRARLKRLVARPMKPTRRQRAIALLVLDEGLSSSQAAEHSGIPKEQVEALAARCVESGLAGVGLDADSKNLVHFIRPGMGVQRYRLRAGATLADLLLRSGGNTTDQAAYVDGIMAEGSLPLHDGAIVTIVPALRDTGIDQPWRATIPSFQDEALFREYTEMSAGADRGDLRSKARRGHRPAPNRSTGLDLHL